MQESMVSGAVAEMMERMAKISKFGLYLVRIKVWSFHSRVHETLGNNDIRGIKGQDECDDNIFGPVELKDHF